VQYHMNDDTYQWVDIGELLPSPDGFTTWTGTFSVPAGVKDVTVFHLIQGVGYLSIGNISLTSTSSSSSSGGGGSSSGIGFPSGAISLSFDDSWLSPYDIARPKMDSYGMKGTFYIVTRQ